MKEKKTCAFESIEFPFFKCPRPVWEDGGSEEKYCLFHSEQMEKKKEEFKKEIEKIKRGEPSELYKIGQLKRLECRDFRGFKFPEGTADFSMHEFKGDVDFRKAQFEGFAWFFQTKIGGYATFEGAEVRGYVWFIGAEIASDTVFDNTKISGHIDLRSAKIYGDIWFERAEIGGNTLFDEAKIGGDLHATEATFGKNIYLISATLRKLDLSAAKSEGNVTLDRARLTSLALDNFEYKGILSLEGTEFKEDDYDRHSTMKNLLLERARFVGTDLSNVAFSGAFIREVIFDRVNFGKAPKAKFFWSRPWFCGRLNEAICEERLAFQQKTEEQETREEAGKNRKRLLKNWRKKIKKSGLIRSRFPQLFLRVKSRLRWRKRRTERFKKLYWSAETTYRTLKHEMEDKHAKGLARRMRAGELECKIQGGRWGLEKILLIGYRFLNGFGLRWLRALAFWLIFVGSLSLFYYGHFTTFERFDRSTGENITIRKVMNEWEAIWHSVEMTSVIAKPSLHIDDPNVRWVEGMERVLSPVLLVLFLQAARNSARD